MQHQRLLCTLAFSSRISSISRSSTGQYSVVLSYTATNNVYSAIITPIGADATHHVTCWTYGTPTTTSFSFACAGAALGSAPAAVDTGFLVAVFDDNN